MRGKFNGAKHVTEAWDCTLYSGRGYSSENAGMSSENYVGIIMAENLRFPGEGSSAQGKPGAKARPKGVVDAHTVEIP